MNDGGYQLLVACLLLEMGRGDWLRNEEEREGKETGRSSIIVTPNVAVYTHIYSFPIKRTLSCSVFSSPRVRLIQE